MLRPNLCSIPEIFSESYREDTDLQGLTPAFPLQYHQLRWSSVSEGYDARFHSTFSRLLLSR